MHSLGVGSRTIGWVWPFLGHAPLPDPEIETHDGATVLALILGILFGAFAGLLAGLILARFIRFGAYLAGRDFEGRGLIVSATICGALLGIWLVLSR